MDDGWTINVDQEAQKEQRWSIGVTRRDWICWNLDCDLNVKREGTAQTWSPIAVAGFVAQQNHFNQKYSQVARAQVLVFGFLSGYEGILNLLLKDKQAY